MKKVEVKIKKNVPLLSFYEVRRLKKVNSSNYISYLAPKFKKPISKMFVNGSY